MFVSITTYITIAFIIETLCMDCCVLQESTMMKSHLSDPLNVSLAATLPLVSMNAINSYNYLLIECPACRVLSVKVRFSYIPKSCYTHVTKAR